MWFRYLMLMAWKVLFFNRVSLLGLWVFFSWWRQATACTAVKSCHPCYLFQRCAIRLTGTRKHQRPKNPMLKWKVFAGLVFASLVGWVFFVGGGGDFFPLFICFGLSFLMVLVSFRSPRVCQTCRHRWPACLNEITWDMKWKYTPVENYVTALQDSGCCHCGVFVILGFCFLIN